MTTLFKETFSTIEEAKKRTNAHNSKQQDLVIKISLAERCLDEPEDRWDYESIKEDLVELNWQLKEHKALRKREASSGQSYRPLSKEETEEVFNSYQLDFATLEKAYKQNKKKAAALTDKYIKEVTPLLREMENAEILEHRASQLDYYLHRQGWKGYKVPRLNVPRTRSNHRASAAMLTALNTLFTKFGGNA